MFERFRDREGDLLREGRMLHAGFALAGRDLSLWRYDTELGPDWFDDQGRSLRRAFLRTPLDGARVTSGFGMRAHPVLGYTRQHQGIDFAAPSGTPVLAASDGEVVQIGWLSGYGRVVTLQHPEDRSTRYAHLSAFSPGLKLGDRVRQGEMIGKVGRTGVATGNHLHYEIAEGGRQIDPSRARTPPRCCRARRWPPSRPPARASRCWPGICSRCRRWRRPNSPGRPLAPCLGASLAGRAVRPQAASASGVASISSPSAPAVTCNCSPSWMRPSSSRLASLSCRFRWITRFSGRAP